MAELILGKMSIKMTKHWNTIVGDILKDQYLSFWSKVKGDETTKNDQGKEHEELFSGSIIHIFSYFDSFIVESWGVQFAWKLIFRLLNF